MKIGVVDITTRANIQLRGMPLEDAADALKGLQQRGLTSVMSGLDNLRNMVGSPIAGDLHSGHVEGPPPLYTFRSVCLSAGLDPFELYDTRELTKKIDAWYSGDGQGNAEWANLPRKFNIAISGSRGLQNVEFHHAHSYTVLL